MLYFFYFFWVLIRGLYMLDRRVISVLIVLCLSFLQKMFFLYLIVFIFLFIWFCKKYRMFILFKFVFFNVVSVFVILSFCVDNLLLFVFVYEKNNLYGLFVFKKWLILFNVVFLVIKFFNSVGLLYLLILNVFWILLVIY